MSTVTALNLREQLIALPTDSEVCLDFLQHLACVMQAPPCDVESDLPLAICEESCTAYDMLMSGSTCDFLDEPGGFLSGLDELQSTVDPR